MAMLPFKNPDVCGIQILVRQPWFLIIWKRVRGRFMMIETLLRTTLWGFAPSIDRCGDTCALNLANLDVRRRLPHEAVTPAVIAAAE